jgi:hypothetical protein
MPYPVTNVKHEVEVPYSYIQPLLYKEIFNFRAVRRIHSIKIEGRSDWGKRKNNCFIGFPCKGGETIQQCEVSFSPMFVGILFTRC